MELRRPECIRSAIARRPARMPSSPRSRGRASVRHSRAVSTPPVRSVQPMDPIAIGGSWLAHGALSVRWCRGQVAGEHADESPSRRRGPRALVSISVSPIGASSGLRDFATSRDGETKAMRFSLEALKAEHGDCLLLHWGTASAPRTVADRRRASRRLPGHAATAADAAARARTGRPERPVGARRSRGLPRAS